MPIKNIIAVFVLVLPCVSQAALNVFTCEPEWAALAKELGGDRLNIFSATTSMQDPHHIEARPSLIAKARNADLLICNGADLEVGWLPLLLRKAGNASIQPGQTGYFLAADHVDMIEIPEKIDRGHGHVHAAGNPHIHTDARNMLVVAIALSQRLQQLDTDNAGHYVSHFDAFRKTWQSKLDSWKAKATTLSGCKIVVHHNFWPYMNRWLGLDQVATLEPLPGVSPSSSHLAKVKNRIGDMDVKVIIRASYVNERASKWMSSHTGVPAVVLPATVDYQGGELLEHWYDSLVESLLKAVQ